MFVTQAHSFTQQARLAVTLAWVAGYTNIVTLIALGGVTSHMSGVASNLGRDVATASWGFALAAMALLVCFFLGAFLSGLCTEFGRRRNWESIYVLPMGIEAVLLGALGLGFLLTQGGVGTGPFVHLELLCVAALAMGLQNATITRISSGVVRTTHVTGVVTDLGLESALLSFYAYDRRGRVRGTPLSLLIEKGRAHPSGRRLALLGTILASFTLGAGLGTWVYARYPSLSMLPPVAFLAWIVFQDLWRPIAEVHESQLLKADVDGSVPPNLGIFHVLRDATRRGKLHRMPNLMAWAERLPESVDVVILDLGQNARLDDNASMELRAVIRLLRKSGKKMILAGVGEQESRELRGLMGAELGAADLCPDLDMALLHALSQLSGYGEESVV